MLVVKFTAPPAHLQFAHGDVGDLYMLGPQGGRSEQVFVYGDRLHSNFRGLPVSEHIEQAIEAGTFHEVSYNSVVHGEEQQDEAPRGRLIFENFRINRWTASASMSSLRSFRASLRSDAREQADQVDMPQGELRGDRLHITEPLSFVDTDLWRGTAEQFDRMHRELLQSQATLRRYGFFTPPSGNTVNPPSRADASPSTEEGSRPQRGSERSRLQESLRTLEENRQREQQRRNALSAQFSERY